jgi:hypothetical protein
LSISILPPLQIGAEVGILEEDSEETQEEEGEEGCEGLRRSEEGEADEEGEEDGEEVVASHKQARVMRPACSKATLHCSAGSFPPVRTSISTSFLF